MENEKAVVLFSGGIDSTVLLAYCLEKQMQVQALTISTHADSKEIITAREIACGLRVYQRVIDLSALDELNRGISGVEFSVGGLSGGCTTIGKCQAPLSIEIMLAVAAMYAIPRGIYRIFWAIHKDDIKNSPSIFTTLGYFSQFIKAGYGPLCFTMPFVYMTKREVVVLGKKLGAPLVKTWSCADKLAENPCGICGQCKERKIALESLEMEMVAQILRATAEKERLRRSFFKNMDKFCEISKKKSPAKILYEDKDIMAFLDNEPYSNGHTLIIPKKHFENIHDMNPRILKKIILLAAKISKKISQNFEGTVILHNTGKLADIPHFHLHIFGKSSNKNTKTRIRKTR